LYATLTASSPPSRILILAVEYYHHHEFYTSTSAREFRDVLSLCGDCVEVLIGLDFSGGLLSAFHHELGSADQEEWVADLVTNSRGPFLYSVIGPSQYLHYAFVCSCIDGMQNFMLGPSRIGLKLKYPTSSLSTLYSPYITIPVVGSPKPLSLQ
jgi:hypothetical protein